MVCLRHDFNKSASPTPYLLTLNYYLLFQIWWMWRSWLARQIVALKAVGSNPIIHPILKIYRVVCSAVGILILGCRQVVRHQTLTLVFVGSNPAIPANNQATQAGGFFDCWLGWRGSFLSRAPRESRFAFAARRSGSLLTRRRACEYSPKAKFRQGGA